MRHERKMYFYLGYHIGLHVVLYVLDVYMFAVGDLIYEVDLQPLATGERGRHFFRIQKEKMDTMFEDIFGKCSFK